MAERTTDHAYWLKRWKEGDTGWHQAEPEEALVRHFADLSPARILVPLCGKSVDLVWLASRGHQVVGVELTEFACEAFFKEQNLKFTSRTAGPLKRYESQQITIIRGDILQVQPADIGPFDTLYDRAALIALPIEIRKYYVEHIKLLAKRSGSGKGFRGLQLLLERTPPDNNGPPYSISEKMLRAYYEDTFKIELLERQDAGMEDPAGVRTKQCVYRLSPK